MHLLKISFPLNADNAVPIIKKCVAYSKVCKTRWFIEHISLVAAGVQLICRWWRADSRYTPHSRSCMPRKLVPRSYQFYTEI